MPIQLWQRYFAVLIAGSILMIFSHLPVILSLFVRGLNVPLFVMLSLSILLPATAILLEWLSKDKLVPRIVLLIAWYIFLSTS